MVTYLVKRLEAAEKTITVSVAVIEAERKLRKTQAKQFKGNNKILRDLVDAERKNLGDKVAEHLDFTLKQAVSETVAVKMRMNDMLKKQKEMENEYQEMQDMYRTIKAENDKNAMLNEECQNVIQELKKDVYALRQDKERL